MPNFTPKPPPTSGAITRIWFCGILSASASPPRSTWGAWWVAHTVRPPLAKSGAAITARVSIGMPERRWLFMRCLTTLWAFAKAASGSPALMVLECSMFLGASSKSWGAPSAMAAKGSATAGSGSQSTSTAAAPSAAASGESPRTAATGSPT